MPRSYSAVLLCGLLAPRDEMAPILSAIPYCCHCRTRSMRWKSITTSAVVTTQTWVDLLVVLGFTIASSPGTCINSSPPIRVVVYSVNTQTPHITRSVTDSLRVT